MIEDKLVSRFNTIDHLHRTSEFRLLILLFMALCITSVDAQSYPDNYDRYVNDFAALLSADQSDQIRHQLDLPDTQNSLYISLAVILAAARQVVVPVVVDPQAVAVHLVVGSW